MGDTEARTTWQGEAERRVAALTLELKAFALEKLQKALEAIAWPAELLADELPHKVCRF